MEPDTITAIATPPGTGGVGIIKISGEQSFCILSKIFQGPSKKNQAKKSQTGKRSARANPIKDRMRGIYHGSIINPETGTPVDDVLVSLMPGPKSYTCEDVVEINTHSGPAVMNAVLNLVLENGARIAEPGEFTRRAYLNGRIDLTQAEAVIDVIEAKTGRALSFAAQQVQGALGQKIKEIREHLQSVIVAVEAGIDFPEDVFDQPPPEAMARRLTAQVVLPLKALLAEYEEGRCERYGIRVMIIGKPNVGKSCLMNCLVKSQRAIVSDVPGTTRDYIEEEKRIKGFPVIFIDTAGVNQKPDDIEKIGIAKTFEHIERADVVLFVIDGSQGFLEEDIRVYGHIKERTRILVQNKVDLVNSKKSLLVPEGLLFHGAVQTSALYGRGINDLEKQILEAAAINIDANGREDRVIINARHQQAIKKAVNRIEDSADGLMGERYEELVAVDLYEGLSYLNEILGINVCGEILDKIFENFCIGK